MTPLLIPGGWYADRWPGGPLAVLIRGSHLLWGWERIDLPPPGDLLWLVAARDQVRLAGIGHDDQAWLWDGAAWTSHGRAWGPRSVIFDAADQLRVAHDGTTFGTGALGWIQVALDGTLTPTFRQYADPSRGLYEYTILSPTLRVGQGGSGPAGDDPLVILLHGVRRLLQPGRCRAIRAHLSGDRLSLAWSQEDRNAAGWWEGSLAEIEALPLFPLEVEEPPPSPPPVPPPPKPPPPSVPPPPPPPKPSGGSMPDHVPYDTFIYPKSDTHPTGEDWVGQIITAMARTNPPQLGPPGAVPFTYGTPTLGNAIWQALVEGWSLRDILHRIKGEPLEDGGRGGYHPPS